MSGKVRAISSSICNVKRSWCEDGRRTAVLSHRGLDDHQRVRLRLRDKRRGERDVHAHAQNA